MARSRELKIAISGDPRSFNRAMGSINKTVAHTESRFHRMAAIGGKAMLGLGAAAGGGLLVGLKKSVDASTDLNEQINKVSVVFRGAEKDILKWSKTTAASLGISRREALESAGVFGNMFVPMGFARKEAERMSKRMVELAADMASFNNADPSEVLDSLRAGLAGETEPLRRFGVFLNDARLKQEAMNLGLKNAVGPNGALTANAKAQATYALILKDTGDAQNDFGRTSKSLANQKRILRAEVENLSASIGNEFTPTVAKGAQELTGFLKEMQSGKGAGGDFARSFKRGFGEVKEEFSGLVDHFKSERKGGASVGAAFASTISEAISDAAPKIAEAAAGAAPRAAGAFVRAWSDSNVWGRLVIGGWLLAKFGGLGAFRKLGVTAGASMEAGMAAGAGGAGVGGAAAGGTGLAAMLSKGGRFGKIARVGAIGVGIAYADALMQALNTRMNARGGDWKKALSAISSSGHEGPKFLGLGVKDVAGDYAGGAILHLAGTSAKAANSADALKKALAGVAEQGKALSFPAAAKLREQIRDLDGVSKEARKQMLALVNVGEGRTKKIDAIGDSFARLRSATAMSVKDMRKEVASNLSGIAETMGSRSKKGKEAIRENFTSAATWIKYSMGDGKHLTDKGMKEMERLLDSHSKAGKRALAANFDEIVPIIRQTMQRGGKVTDAGLRMIRQLYVQSLRLAGLNPQQAINIGKGRNLSGGLDEGSLHYDASDFDYQNKKATGGWIGAQGQAGRDEVPAMLGRGEAVLNRHQQPIVNAGLAAVGVPGGLQELFQKVRKPHYLAQGGLLPGHPELKPGISRLANIVLNRFPGLHVSSTTGGGHAAGSYHYRGMAVDLSGAGMEGAANWIKGRYTRSLAEGIHNPNLSVKGGSSVSPSFWGAKTWADHLDHIHLAVSGRIAPPWKMIPRILVGGRASALHSIAQGALDNLRNAANAKGKAAHFASGGFALGDLTQLALNAGFNKQQAAVMAAIAMAESSGNPGAVGDGGHSFGLWQVNKPSHPWAHDLRNPVENAKAARRIFLGSGYSPWTMYNNGTYRRYLPHAQSIVRGQSAGGSAGGGKSKTPHGTFGPGKPNKVPHLGSITPLPGFQTVSPFAKSRAEQATLDLLSGQQDTAITLWDSRSALTDEDLGTAAGRKARVGELEVKRFLQSLKLGSDQGQANEIKRRIRMHRREIRRLLREKKRKGLSDARQIAIANEIAKHRRKIRGLKGDLYAMGQTIEADKIDILETTGEIADVVATPNAEDTTVYDWLEDQLGFIDAKVRAGDITAEQGHQAKMDLLTKASTDPRLSSGQQLEVRGQLRDESGFVDAASDLAAALKGVQDEMKRQNDFATSVANVTSHEAVRALADVISGQIGGYYSTRSFSPGAGQVVRY